MPIYSTWIWENNWWQQSEKWVQLLRRHALKSWEHFKSTIHLYKAKRPSRKDTWMERVASRMAQNAHSRKTGGKMCPLRLATRMPLFQLRYPFNAGTLLCTWLHAVSFFPSTSLSHYPMDTFRDKTFFTRIKISSKTSLGRSSDGKWPPVLWCDTVIRSV